MRILHLLSQTQLTGAEVYAQQLVQYQLQQGHQVFVISDAIHVDLGTSWTSLPLSRSDLKSRFFVFFRLRQFLLKNKIEVIHCHSRGAVRHAAVARLGTPIAQVSTIHGKQHASFSKRFFDTYGEYKILICENLFQQFEKDFRVSARSLRLLRNPFQLESLPFLESSLRTSGSRPRWAFVGRSSGPKGQRLREFFETGFFRFLETHPEIEFDVIAPHPELWGEDFLKKLRSLGSRVQVLGHIKDLPQHLKTYQTVLAAGRVAIESLLLGIQVVGFGEAEEIGLITEDNLSQALISNFGDISAESTVRPVNTPLLINSLLLAKESFSNEATRRRLRERVASQYSTERIQPLILDVYRSAIFKRFRPQWIPILMYHKIPEKPLLGPHRIFVTRDRFEQHLQFFQRKNFTTLTFSELKKFWSGEKSLNLFPKKPLLLTFDDGYKDNLTNAVPLLRQYNMKATLYLLSDHSMLENTWDQGSAADATLDPLMSREEKKAVALSGVFEIGSHGINHLRLPDLGDGEVLQQMVLSKQQLEKDLAVPIESFAYPFGAIDPRLPILARQAGYQFAVNTDQGGLELSENPWSLFRVNIFPEDGAFQLWKKTSSWYRKSFWRKRGK